MKRSFFPAVAATALAAATVVGLTGGGLVASAASPGLVAAYSFDDGAGGTATDNSGHGRAGAVVGATWVAAGKHGSALSFDGSSSHVDLPPLGTFYKSGFTLEAWVKKSGTKQDVAVVGSWAGGSDGGPMIWDDHIAGRYYLTLNKGTPADAYLDSGTAPSPGTWQHLAATYDGATARFYVDGALAASRPFGGDVGSSDVFRIGAYGPSPTGFFDGLIDEVRIYDRALTATEIAGDVNASVDDTAPTAPSSLTQLDSTAGSVTIGWNAATDDSRVAGYRVYRDGVETGTPAGTTAIVGGLACDTQYSIGVEAYDPAGNSSTRTVLANATTAACDSTPPAATVTAPLANATVSGVVPITASASDNDEVAAVQLLVDGLPYGAEEASPPYSIQWDTRLTTNGTHTVGAIARDRSGNVGQAPAVTVTVNNGAAPPPGLVAAYSFDEATNTIATDDSGNGKTGTVVGAASGVGKFGAALSFNGTGDNVALPALGTFYKSSFTYEAWVRKASSKQDVAVVGTWAGGQNGGPMIWVDHISGRYYLTLNAGSLTQYLDSGRAPVVGQWQHLAASYDGSTARFYVDGAVVASKAFTGNVGDSNGWRIGAYGASPGGFWDGLIDEVRIYDRALTQTEIARDMNASVADPDVTPPSQPTHFVRTGSNATTISTSWSPSTDDVGVAAYNLYRDGVKVGSTTTTSYTFTGLLCNTVANLAVEAVDAAGNTSARTALLGSSTSACDTTAPTVSLTAPAPGNVAGTVSVTAAASDNDVVGGVQFMLNGAPLGAEDTTLPYAVAWDTRLAANGPHALTAVARDASGNTATAAEVAAVVDNGTPPPAGLRAAYSFDDGAGIATADLTGNGNTGALLGASWVAGRYGSALSFSGTGDRVDLPPLGTFYRSAFTLEAWVRKQTAKVDVAVVGSWAGGQNGGPMIWVDHVTGHYRLTLNAGALSTYLDSGVSPAVGQWQHVAATFDGATARFYVNGVPAASMPFAGNVGDTNTWRVGAYGATPTGFFDGLIDEVRIYDRALSASELQDDMSTPVGALDRTPPSTPTGFSATGSTATSISLAWNAASDAIGVVGYRVYRNGLLASVVSGTSETLSSLTCDTQYDLAVAAFDAAGTESSETPLTGRTSACDVTAPTVGLTAPLGGAVIANSVTVAATAGDDDAVAGVQFRLDGADLAVEDTSAPYAMSWDTRMTTNGPHVLTAVARDLSGNRTTSAPVSVTVDNGSAPRPGLVGAYAFDEGLGSAVADDSGLGNGGTAANTTWTVGRHGAALLFNGSSSMVTVPASPSLALTTGMTLEAWVLPTSLGTSWRSVIFKEQPGNVIYDLYANTSTSVPSTSIFVDGSEVDTRGASGLALNAWTHLAASYDGSALRLYVNGALTRTTAVSGAMPTSGEPLRIGGNSIFPEWFQGRIDDVRIYDRALSAAEIASDMSTPAASDTDPPRVASVTPENGAADVSVGVTAKVTFTEAMDPASITSSSIALTGPGGSVVPTTVTYDPVSGTASVAVASALAYGTAYTVTVHGGASAAAVEDLAGNKLSADHSFSFTSEPPPPPILLVTSSDPFSRYPAEILRAEGLDAFTTIDASLISESFLHTFDVVVLGVASLSPEQVTTLSNWVTSGGKLIALRPDKQLAGLLGLAATPDQLSEGYIQVDTSSAPGLGIVGQTMQFHGTADRYSIAPLSGARAVATLFSDATTATSSPAVTLRSVGTSGGESAAFTYDLARSVMLSRQGNPAWAGQERDGIAPIRPSDLFFGGASPNWVDLDRVAIPQADEQQRLLANLITTMTADRKPIPRFWYFPRGEKAAIVMTGDDHAVGGTAGRFDKYLAASPPGCVVDNWECIRATSYVYPSSPLTDAQAASYLSKGFEIAAHVLTGCANWTPSQLEGDFDNDLAQFAARYTSLPAPASSRTHCVAWSDWATEPKVELEHGIRLDTNYYWYPASVAATHPGFQTGSGMPMRFADLDGSLIDVYQAATQMTDESGQSYPFTVDALLDKALGPEGYYGFFTANMHTDLVDSQGSDAIVASAQARDVPIISARQLLTWVDGRNASAFQNLTWAGGNLDFSIKVGAGANGLQAMLPLRSDAGDLSAISRGGSSVVFTTGTIKGVAYAFFNAVAGQYTAHYAP